MLNPAELDHAPGPLVVTDVRFWPEEVVQVFRGMMTASDPKLPVVISTFLLGG